MDDHDLRRTVGVASRNVVKLLRRGDPPECAYCGHPLAVLPEHFDPEIEALPRPGYRVAESDHAQPRSRGGLDDLSNRVLACADCNRAKGDDDVEDAFPWLVEGEL